MVHALLNRSTIASIELHQLQNIYYVTCLNAFVRNTNCHPDKLFIEIDGLIFLAKFMQYWKYNDFLETYYIAIYKVLMCDTCYEQVVVIYCTI